MPDFDIDFCETHRDKVIAYVQRQIRPRPGRPDHHLRPAEGARGAQGHRPRAADELRPGRPAGQADPQPSDRSVDARARAQRRRRARRRISRRRRRQAAVRPGDEARGPAAPRLDPRRRRGHRRPPARRAGAALPRPALGHAGHPVRHEICRGGGAGEVRLPRPEDAVGAQGGPASCSPQQGVEVDFDDAAVGRSRRSTSCSSAATRSACSSSNPKACGGRWPRSARPASATSSRWSRSTGPGPMDNIPHVRRPQERPRRRSPIRTRCSRRCSRKPTASSSTRSR